MSLQKLHLTLAALGIPGGLCLPGGRFRPKPHPKKTCPQCKQPHTTGMAFCSANCCHTYKAEHKAP